GVGGVAELGLQDLDRGASSGRGGARGDGLGRGGGGRLGLGLLGALLYRRGLGDLGQVLVLVGQVGTGLDLALPLAGGVDAIVGAHVEGQVVHGQPAEAVV